MDFLLPSSGTPRLNTDIRKPDVVDFHNTISKWLYNPRESFYKISNGVRLSEYNLYNSPHTIPSESTPGNIVLIQQFYLPEDEERREELKLALRCNCHNNAIDRIVLLKR